MSADLSMNPNCWLTFNEPLPAPTTKNKHLRYFNKSVHWIDFGVQQLANQCVDRWSRMIYYNKGHYFKSSKDRCTEEPRSLYRLFEEN